MQEKIKFMSRYVGYCQYIPQLPFGGLVPGRVLAVYIKGGPTELHIANPPKIFVPEILHPKIPGIIIFYPQNTRLKYLNTNLFYQTDFKT